LLAEIALKVKNNQERQARFDGWYEEAAAERPTPRMRPIYFVLSGVAAALIILFLFVLPDKQPTTTGTPEEWFTEAYEPYLPPEVRSTVLTTDSLRQKAYVLILEGEHAAAIPLLQTLIRQETASEGQIQNDRLYLASCFLSEGKAAAALEILQASPPITGDDAIWYEALALLKLARLTEAQPLFQDLASREVPFYGPKSQQLLEKIDQRL
ncbi:MAG: tetratricopeptide repeat protein, partial [Bacteroidota bacterium]